MVVVSKFSDQACLELIHNFPCMVSMSCHAVIFSVESFCLSYIWSKKSAIFSNNQLLILWKVCSSNFHWNTITRRTATCNYFHWQLSCGDLILVTLVLLPSPQENRNNGVTCDCFYCSGMYYYRAYSYHEYH